MRATRAIETRLGYSEPVVDYALDRLFEEVTRESLRSVIVSELGSVEALDGFAKRPGRPDVFFRGVSNVAILSSDTTVGVALPPLLFALCAKARVLVKDRSDDLIAAFAETILEERPELGELLRVEAWDGTDEAESSTRLAGAEVVIAFGGDETLRTIRSGLRADARFVPYAHRISAGYVARESLADESSAAACAFDAARDALLYDGSGCLSLALLFVERGGAIEPATFTRLLGRACEQVAIEFPSKARAGTAALAYHKRLEFASAQAEKTALVRAGEFVVALDPIPAEPPPLMQRTLPLYAVDGPGEALAFIERHRLPLEGFAVSPAQRADVLDVALRSGAARLTRLGRLQAPPLAGNHGAKERILPFVQAIYRDL